MRYVLFVCTQNAGRSQIAEAFFTAAAPSDLRAESAGHPLAKEVHPAVVEAMAEVGIDPGASRRTDGRARRAAAGGSHG